MSDINKLREKTLRLFGTMEEQLRGVDKFVFTPDEKIVVTAVARKTRWSLNPLYHAADIPGFHNHIITNITRALRHVIDHDATAKEYYDWIVTSPTAISYAGIFQTHPGLAEVVARAFETYVPEPGMDQVWCYDITDMLLDVLPGYVVPDHLEDLCSSD